MFAEDYSVECKFSIYGLVLFNQTFFIIVHDLNSKFSLLFIMLRHSKDIPKFCSKVNFIRPIMIFRIIFCCFFPHPKTTNFYFTNFVELSKEFHKTSDKLNAL